MWGLFFKFFTGPAQMTIDESTILVACEKKKEYILSNLEYVRRVCLRPFRNLPGLVELEFEFLGGSRPRTPASRLYIHAIVRTNRISTHVPVHARRAQECHDEGAPSGDRD